MLYATRIPIWNAPDEPAHFNYARAVAAGRLPVLEPDDWDAERLERLKAARFPPSEPFDRVEYEDHQPPLYYAIVAPTIALTPGLNERQQGVLVRAATVPIGVAAILAVWLYARAALPGRPTLTIAAAGLAAIIPMRVAGAASVSNDALAELCVSLCLWRAAYEIDTRAGDRHPVVLGALVGVALLAKLSAYVVVPVVALAIMLSPRDLRVRARRLFLAAAVAALVAGWWFARNSLVYGPLDPFGLRRHDLVVAGQPLSGAPSLDLLVHSTQTLFRSFWGQFGWMGVVLDRRLYLLFAAMTAVAFVGLLLALLPGGAFRRLAAGERRALALGALAVALVGLGIGGYNLTYLQPQGRYLFPALAPIALAAAGGARALLGRRLFIPVIVLVVVAMALLDVAILYRFILPDLAPRL